MSLWSDWKPNVSIYCLPAGENLYCSASHVRSCSDSLYFVCIVFFPVFSHFLHILPTLPFLYTIFLHLHLVLRHWSSVFLPALHTRFLLKSLQVWQSRVISQNFNSDILQNIAAHLEGFRNAELLLLLPSFWCSLRPAGCLLYPREVVPRHKHKNMLQWLWESKIPVSTYAVLKMHSPILTVETGEKGALSHLLTGTVRLS